MQPEQERSAPQVVSEPDPPYDSDKQQRPGLESRYAHPAALPGEPLPGHSGKLEGKAALITGGDSGIGRAVALLYAREGADVAIVHLPEEQVDAERVRRESRGPGPALPAPARRPPPTRSSAARPSNGRRRSSAG
ncbi:SDR family oxidoreductase OS=Streptomyces violarus OX=67380 GN=FHS41_005067 PE=3 SV=1 [Streptomyces violarus]